MFKNQIFIVKSKLARLSRSIATNVLGPLFWKMGIVFLTRQFGNPRRIGEMALQFDLYVKMGFLGYGPSSRGILLAREEEISNLCLMKYWQRYICVISHPLLFHLFFPFAALTQYNTYYVKMPDGKVLYEGIACRSIQQQWEEQGRQQLLTLSGSHYKRGWDCLEKLGVPRGSWFVCLHVRDGGYLNERDDSPDTYRNADINTYLLAAKTIVNAGGWVIRMGDPTMKHLPPMDHVIDYVHNEAKSDWMDIFCCAECRFFLGTNSGLLVVPFVFGVPCALANITPMQERPLSGKDVFIPKLNWSEDKERYLTFEEAISPQLRYCYDSNIFKSLKIRIIDNTPEEINDLVLEMLERLNGNFEYNEEDECLQERFYKLLLYQRDGNGSRIGNSFQDARYKAIDQYKRNGIGSRIGSSFLRKYACLLSSAKL